MMQLNVHSQNLRGSITKSLDIISSSFRSSTCECTAFFLQDIGSTGPEGPPLLRNNLGDHMIFANSSTKNKSRTVAVVIHQSWSVSQVYRDPSGSLIGVVASRAGLDILFVSAYLPSNTDIIGYPDLWNTDSKLPTNVAQQEVHSIYSSLLKWTTLHPLWIVCGDFNETRSSMDRLRTNSMPPKPLRKFINVFLEESEGIDTWRTLYPDKPGFTFKTAQNEPSFSRIDYCLMGPMLFQLLERTQMRLGNWNPKISDHVQINICGNLPNSPGQKKRGKPWSIPQPRLSGITAMQRQKCQENANLALTPLLQQVRDARLSLDDADNISKHLAQCLIDTTSAVVGSKLPTHEKGKYHSSDLVKAQAEINTISKARDLIRTLYLNEVNTQEEKRLVEDHLTVLLDRLCVMGLRSIPRSLDLDRLHEWSELKAPTDILDIRAYMEQRRWTMDLAEKERQRKLFLNPKNRGRWFERVFGTRVSVCPNFAIDSKTGRKTFEENEVKKIYVQEGASLLKNKIELPPPYEEKMEAPLSPPPDPRARSNLHPPPKPNQRPKWWEKMYNRQAKGIKEETWSSLMGPTDWKEVRDVIASNGSEKSAGWDGVSCDLVELHSESSVYQPSPFLEILTSLINTSLKSGKTLISWRKAIISMIPKRKDDGSLTTLISEMRPISVLQEFGKISAKLISNRLGNILLQQPSMLNSAQRAFLKDGCTAQCLNTLLNVIEDFQTRKKTDKAASLFLLAYDQVKAYDSVQAYTIKASLERFNLPPEFISYVLSNLENATSCFKTFYGPTEDFLIETSVRQGDPLSPLIYIFVTDALHEGLRSNPLFNCKTGYTFSNNKNLTVASLGYADDTLTLNESWKDQWMAHEWVRDFCHAHHFRLNSLKCKYIISDCSGKTDGRWLWSVDGKEKIQPLISSECFRYLGLWLTMDLDWSKQIHVLNKCIMDWRWKALAFKVDPAQLRASYCEFLFPRLEVGLLYANISMTICNTWMSSIIATFCDRSGISSGHSLNHMAFCLLADIPDLWLRTQTARATELICLLNSKNSPAGSSTVARLCAFAKSPNVSLATTKLQEMKRFPTSNDFRFTPTLKHLKSIGIQIVSSHKQESARVLSIVQEIKTALEHPQVCQAIVYTDGSTNPKNQHPNSGSGIFITDEHHTPLWSGGLVVRSDGNNFIAELAAAAIVVKACPSNLPLLLRIDSLAAIGAISKGTVSERKRVRASGRAWLNFSRAKFLEKLPTIRIEHVSSHKGTATPEQVGNDNADRLANKFRLIGESSTPALYLWDSEESLLFKHSDKNVQGDPRSYLKKLEKDLMTKSWKEKAPKQSEWFAKFPTQVLKQSKQVWKWAVESGVGKSWLYFIFAVCQWLPTNYRMNYHHDMTLKQCNLCLGGSLDTMDHLLQCPALAKEQHHLKEVITAKFNFWEIPFSCIPQKSHEQDLRNRCRLAARQHFPSSIISDSKLDLLAKGFYKYNSKKQFISTRQFIENLSELLQHRRPARYELRDDLVSLLIRTFTLQTQGLTDSWNFCPLFDDWTSVNPYDVPFGARLWATITMHEGCNAFFLQTPENNVNIQGLLEILAESLETKLPTRFLLIIPEQKSLPSHFLKIATLDPRCPLFSYDYSVAREILPCSMSIVLALNKESMAIDPIDWESFCDQISTFSQNWPHNAVKISPFTDALFRERTQLPHLPRTLSKQSVNLHLKSTLSLNFYDAFTPKTHLNLKSIPSRAAALIRKANQHPWFLGVLGILPNQLRTLLKESGHDCREEALLDISRTLFLAGYSLWSKRQKLNSKFWKEIAPENREQKTSKRKKRKLDDVASQSKCRNPFHFLVRHSNLSQQRPTKCPCRNMPHKNVYKTQSITAFISRFPQTVHYDKARSDSLSISPSNINLYTTRADEIRKQHDRGKKRKKT